MSKAIIDKVLVVMLCVMMSGQAFAQTPWKAVLDKDTIRVGEQAILLLELQLPQNSFIEKWPQIPDSFGKLEILDEKTIDTQRADNFLLLSQQFILTGFDSGLFVLPALEVLVKEDQQLHTWRTLPLPLLVQTVVVDTSQPFKSIKDIEEVPAHWSDYLPWVAIFLVLLLATLLLIYFIRKKKKVSKISIPGPQESLPQKYLRLLRELEMQQLWQQGNVKEYYVGLSDLMRGYMEERFGFPARELSTAEINSTARRQPELRVYRTIIRDILMTADMAKFAKATPEEAQHMQVIKDVEAFIIQSQQQSVTPENLNRS